jgi:hypothetical protein
MMNNYLVNLPIELIENIVEYVSVFDCFRLNLTCKSLSEKLMERRVSPAKYREEIENFLHFNRFNSRSEFKIKQKSSIFSQFLILNTTPAPSVELARWIVGNILNYIFRVKFLHSEWIG